MGNEMESADVTELKTPLPSSYETEPADVTELKTPLPSSYETEPADVTHPENPLPPSYEDRIRLLLVIATIGLMFTTLLIYAITREVFVLGTTPIDGIAVNSVFKYFFTRR
jgi:hypothetical protein